MNQNTKVSSVLSFLPKNVKVLQANFGAFNLDSEIIFVDERIASKEKLEELHQEFISKTNQQVTTNTAILVDFIDFVNKKFQFEENYFEAEILHSADLHWNIEKI